MGDVPVAAGLDGAQAGVDTFTPTVAATGFDYLPPETEGGGAESGAVLLLRAYESAAPTSLTLLLDSSLADAAAFIRSHEELFVAKTERVAVFGNPEPSSVGESAAELLPDPSAANFKHDLGEACFVFSKCQQLGVPLVLLTRFAAYASQLPSFVYDELAATGHPVGVRVRDAQREAIARLWRRAHATTPAGRAHLPERCDPRWFRDTFCNGRGEDLGAGDDVWDLVVGFNLYDVIALLACCPALRAAHFSPHSVNVAGVRHHDAPRVHGNRVAVRPPLFIMRAGLGRCQDVGLRLHRPRAE